MQRTRWVLVAVMLSLALAQPASAAGKPATRGDPKTTYDQNENAAHNGKGSSSAGSSTEAMSTSSQVGTSATSQVDAGGHWLVRRVTTSSSGQWTLYDSGEIKQVGGL